MGVVPHALSQNLLKDFARVIPLDSVHNLRTGRSDWPGISYLEMACLSLWNSAFKKFKAGMTEETNRLALEKFLSVDFDCKNWKLQFERYGDDFLWGEFRLFLNKFWFPRLQPIVTHDYDCLERGSLGPGNSIGSPGDDFYTKLFSSNLSCTRPYLSYIYRRYIKGFPEWASAELIRQANYGDPCVVEGNRLSFVPKNDDISRTICTEPVLNMYFQLGFGSILCSRLAEFSGIELKDQQFRNRELARKGSRDGSFVTIDLSSASDSISLNMLKASLPKSFLDFLLRYRCEQSRLPDGKLHTLNMISTMGNGFTFPLQTVIFVCVVFAAFKLSGLAPVYSKDGYAENFGVNGDDIVVPKEIAPKVLRLLHVLGFKANPAKTFVEGPFRESCGGDYFKGRSLRGVYFKKFTSEQDTYVAINQLNLFTARTGIPLRNTVRYLLHNCRYLPVPPSEADDAGIRVPFSLIREPYTLDKDTQSICYFGWKPVPVCRIRIGESALFIPRSLKRRIYNPSGLLIAFLQRSVNSCTILPRAEVVRYKKKRLVIPFWDMPRPVHPLSGWVDWQRWNTAVSLNLFN